MNEKEKMAALIDCIQILERAANRFAGVIGKPFAIQEEGLERFRYTDPDSRHFQVLRAVRVSSGLYACVHLLNEGHTQEIGVLLRTIQEFLEDINFVQEAHEAGQRTLHQQRIIDNFFQEDLRTTEEMRKEERKIDRVPRKKVRASHGRLCSKIQNPEETQLALSAIYDGLSGYVHGGYPHIMELYEGDLHGGPERFRMRGMLGTPKVKPFRQQISCYVHRSFNTFYTIARVLGQDDLAEELLKRRKEFEKTKVYTD